MFFKLEGSPFYSEVKFPKVKIPERGVYKFSAWAFVDCDGLGCLESKDFITIMIKYDDQNFGEINVLSTDVVFDEAWRYFEYEFQSTGKDVEVNYSIRKA